MVWVGAILFITAMTAVIGGKLQGLDAQQKYAVFSSLFTFRMVGLLSAVFSTAVISQEIEQKTIVYLLTRPISRVNLLLARWLACAVVVFGLSVLCAAGIAMGTHTGFGGQFPRDILALLFGSFTYTALFTLVSLLVNRAMTVNLLYAFGWELLSANMPGNLYYTSIFSYMSSIAKHVGLDSDDKNFAILAGQVGNTVATPTALIVCACLTAFVMAVGCWWFRENEFLPREDAE